MFIAAARDSVSAINIPEGCPPDFRVSIHSLAGSTLLFIQIKVVVPATAVTFLDKVEKLKIGYLQTKVVIPSF
ncbi:hypothetical protein ACLB1R_35130 [Escherichia coli]